MKIPRIKRDLLWPMLILILFAVSGCGTSPRPDFYHLEQDASTQLTGLERGLAIGIGPVNMAPYLDRPQIVTRSGSHKLELSEFHRWSEPLKISVSRIIGINLSNLLETNRVYQLPRRNKSIPLDFQVAIDIARFDGQLGGDARLTARWSLHGKDGKPLLTKVSIITEATEGEDFEHLVAAENRALQKLSTEIADAIRASP